ncbi:predicted protein [Chaetoceros tenuissimus]|uniref:Uncharacterized protein n=1 Tax=Chaetoceros tenuissimus TaxID=426638 RepID=A0AAD3HCA3_9STRA|nr:predicted protein [Chaetoceros tenuissimus]
MFNKDKTLEAFKDVSDLTMAYHALDYKARLGGPEAKIWMASTSNKVAKSDLKKHLNAFHKLDDVEIKKQFPMLIDHLHVKKEKE